MTNRDLHAGKNTFGQSAIPGFVPHCLSRVAIDEKARDRMLPRRAAWVERKDASARREQIAGETERGDRFIVTQMMQQPEHDDEIFESRLVRGALVASRLVRVAEPQITWRWENADLALDDYLARHATTGPLVAQGDTILVERTCAAPQPRSSMRPAAGGRISVSIIRRRAPGPPRVSCRAR